MCKRLKCAELFFTEFGRVHEAFRISTHAALRRPAGLFGSMHTTRCSVVAPYPTSEPHTRPNTRAHAPNGWLPRPEEVHADPD